MPDRGQDAATIISEYFESVRLRGEEPELPDVALFLEMEFDVVIPDGLISHRDIMDVGQCVSLVAKLRATSGPA